MTRPLCAVALIAALGIAPGGCSTAPPTEEARADLSTDASAAMERFRRDAFVQSTLDSAAGYAVIPVVSKGAAVVGAARGRGEVYKGGKLVGYCYLREGTLGLQVGGQRYSELIVFDNEATLDDFMSGDMEITSSASAVASEAGSARKTEYRNGVLVFITDEKGLMLEAAVGGQRFRFEPV
jgi:lipid-binding SYLF domain-containing protein